MLSFVVSLKILMVLAALSFSQARIPRLDITAEAPRYDDAVREYRRIWDTEGKRIVEAMERATSLRLEAGPIPVVVFEGASSSGFRDIPMKLRASYPEPTKRATLVHELAHRLISERIPKTFDSHPIIFLFVYDVWVELWGKQFADEQVVIESGRRGLYDYETAWKNTLKLTAQERAEQFKKFVIEHPARN